MPDGYHCGYWTPRGILVDDRFNGIVSPLTLGGTHGALQIATDDVEAVRKQALEAGAEVFRPLRDAFWGERHGQVADPFGRRSGLPQSLRDVPPQEIAAVAAKLFGA